MKDKKDADQRYLKSKQDLEQLQEQLKGTSAQESAERTQLREKQEKLERERNLMVNQYEGEIEKLRA